MSWCCSTQTNVPNMPTARQIRLVFGITLLVLVVLAVAVEVATVGPTRGDVSQFVHKVSDGAGHWIAKLIGRLIAFTSSPYSFTKNLFLAFRDIMAACIRAVLRFQVSIIVGFAESEAFKNSSLDALIGALVFFLAVALGVELTTGCGTRLVSRCTRRCRRKIAQN